MLCLKADTDGVTLTNDLLTEKINGFPGLMVERSDGSGVVKVFAAYVFASLRFSPQYLTKPMQLGSPNVT